MRNGKRPCAPRWGFYIYIGVSYVIQLNSPVEFGYINGRAFFFLRRNHPIVAPHCSFDDEIMAVASSAEFRHNPSNLLRRFRPSVASGSPDRSSGVDPSEDILEIIAKTSSLSIRGRSRFKILRLQFTNIISPLILTVLSACVRLYRIDASSQVLWDEAHFGKFGSYYLQREYYFDVHPPLGKMLVALTGYLTGYDGSFNFGDGGQYPETFNYAAMRRLNCLFGIACTPVAYWTCRLMGLSMYTTWYISLLVIFEMLSLILAKLILLDSILLFFTACCFLGLVKIHQLRVQNRLSSKNGLKWFIFTGVFVGCVCSTKMVGLLITILLGLYTIYDLMLKTYQVLAKESKYSKSAYIVDWLVRGFTLIVLPLTIYLASFRLHFFLLNHGGTEDGGVSTLMQANFKDSSILRGPRSVAYGSFITVRSQGLMPHLLHSHDHTYPEGSQQQQVTTYSHKDDNNWFMIDYSASEEQGATFFRELDEANTTKTLKKFEVPPRSIADGDTVRIFHNMTGKCLRSHVVEGHLKIGYEVSCFSGGDDHDSTNEEWVVEVMHQSVSPSPDFADEDALIVHPISSSLRFKHKNLGCYLSASGFTLPSWGYDQGEVICSFPLLVNDKSAWWNIEDHANSDLPLPESNYVAPPIQFWKEFFILNYGMMISNNALIPDTDKEDTLSSEWWQWPTLHKGLRMGSWDAKSCKYYLIGHPFITLFTTFSIFAFVPYLLLRMYQWRRQRIRYNVFDHRWNVLLVQGLLPFLGWVLHYYPFIVMGRVTYLHHYAPAIYFAIFVSGFMLERLVYAHCTTSVTVAVYGVVYLMILSIFWRFRPLAFGMEGSPSEFAHLRLFKSWDLTH